MVYILDAHSDKNNNKKIRNRFSCPSDAIEDESTRRTMFCLAFFGFPSFLWGCFGGWTLMLTCLLIVGRKT